MRAMRAIEQKERFVRMLSYPVMLTVLVVVLTSFLPLVVEIISKKASP